ncbi:MAG: hypothetical protein JRJ02_03545 [Deltaproteobacteria bacterium]|nr:hypothetical protein [Deltaproteobacteria bacterium]
MKTNQKSMIKYFLKRHEHCRISALGRLGNASVQPFGPELTAEGGFSVQSSEG